MNMENRCVAERFRYDEIIQTKFIEGFREGRYQLMIMDLNWNGSVLILNEGRKYFENYLLM